MLFLGLEKQPPGRGLKGLKCYIHYNYTTSGGLGRVANFLYVTLVLRRRKGEIGVRSNFIFTFV